MESLPLAESSSSSYSYDDVTAAADEGRVVERVSPSAARRPRASWVLSAGAVVITRGGWSC